jgi:hypothetical protein
MPVSTGEFMGAVPWSSGPSGVEVILEIGWNKEKSEIV